MTVPMIAVDGELEDLLGRVSYHAVTRYVQRIMHRDIYIPPEDLPAKKSFQSRFIAERHCEAVGKSIDQVRELIMVPAVAAACLSGLGTIYTPSFEAVINPKNGIVVTIAARRAKSKHKCRIPTKAETKRKMNRANRAERRKPASELKRR